MVNIMRILLCRDQVLVVSHLLAADDAMGYLVRQREAVKVFPLRVYLL